MKYFFLYLTLFLTQEIFAQDKTLAIIFNNKTGQDIIDFQYWIGANDASMGAGLVYKSRASVPKEDSTRLSISYNKKTQNTILIKAYLKGGGYASLKYNIEEGDTKQGKPIKVSVYNPATPINTKEFEKVMEEFRKLNLSNGNYVEATQENAIGAFLGAIYIYDGDKIVHKISPEALGTKIKNITPFKNKRIISGIFSRETSVRGDVNLPFVSASTAFSSGDVAKFTWELENFGQYNWVAPNGKDISELFPLLPAQTKKTLIHLYETYPNLTMKFLDKAFIISRVEYSASKTQKIALEVSLNGANYVTAAGNYTFLDGLEESDAFNDIVTEIEGYDVTILLKSLYVEHLAEKTQNLTNIENNKITSEYTYFRELYPEVLKETTDVEIMKKALINLKNNPDIKFSYISIPIQVENITQKPVEIIPPSGE